MGQADHGALGLELEPEEHKYMQENWSDDSDEDLGRIIRKHVQRTRSGGRRQMLRPTPEDELVKYDIELHYADVLQPQRMAKFETMKKRPRMKAIECGAYSSYSIAGAQAGPKGWRRAECLRGSVDAPGPPPSRDTRERRRVLLGSQ